MARWKHRPEGSTWGDWGEDDQLGRLNLITAEKVRQGVAEVREGISFCLSLPLDYPGGSLLNPRRSPPVLQPTSDADGLRFNFPMSKIDPHYNDVLCDDRVLLTLQYSTQWDALSHIGSHFDADGDGKPEPLFYNGFRAGSDVVGPHDYGSGAAPGQPSSAHKLGIENMAAACVQGRGVLIDLERQFGRARTQIGYDEMMRAAAAGKVEVERGDMVLLHTGFATMVLEMNRAPDAQKLHNSCAVLNGRDAKLLNWITDSGLAVLVADNYAVEGVPPLPGHGDCHAGFPLHEHCLFKLGVHLGELWYLHELATWLRAHGRSRFLLTAPPLRLPGAVGSPATPVATV
ncbi:MAG: cyclase family protein [Reyranellaceae bacterium]